MSVKDMPPYRMIAGGGRNPDGSGSVKVIGGEEVAGLRLRVAVAVSNTVSRCGLEALLRQSPVVGDIHAADGQSMTEDVLAESRCDLVIASASMARQECPELAEATRRYGARLLVMLRGQDRGDVARAVTVGADGYLFEEDLTAQVLDETIRRLMRGEMLLPTFFVQNLLETSHERRPVRAPQVLTRRERHVLRLLVDGLSNKQIATELRISQHGAKRHVANLLAKLNCTNRTHAVALALQGDMLNDQPLGPAQRQGTGI